MSVKNKKKSSVNFLVRAEFLTARPPDCRTARPPLVITIPLSFNGWGVKNVFFFYLNHHNILMLRVIIKYKCFTISVLRSNLDVRFWRVGRRAERVNHMDHLIINLHYHAYTVTDVYTILHDIISSCADIRKKPRQTRWSFLWWKENRNKWM